MDVTQVDGFQICHLRSLINKQNCVPSPLQVTKTLQANKWTLRQDWQTPAEVYRVLNDLHTRQRFVDIDLLYLSELQLMVICGREPRGDAEEEKAPECPLSDDVAVRVFPLDVSGGAENKQGCMVFVLPGKFLTAVLTGSLRTALEKVLEQAADVVEQTLGWARPVAGWTLAVTDCDQVCYYVERMISVNQLKCEAGLSHEKKMERIFGKSRVFNRRRVDIRKMQRERQEQQQFPRGQGVAPTPEVPPNNAETGDTGLEVENPDGEVEDDENSEEQWSEEEYDEFCGNSEMG